MVSQPAPCPRFSLRAGAYRPLVHRYNFAKPRRISASVGATRYDGKNLAGAKPRRNAARDAFNGAADCFLSFCAVCRFRSARCVEKQGRCFGQILPRLDYPDVDYL